MSEMKKKRIVVAGGGTAGWSAAVSVVSYQMFLIFPRESEAIAL